MVIANFCDTGILEKGYQGHYVWAVVVRDNLSDRWVFIGVEKILDGGRRRFFQIYHQKYSCGMKHMRPKNGTLSGLQRKNGARLYKRLY